MNFNVKNGVQFLKNIHGKGFFHLLSANVLIQIFAFGSQLFIAGILPPDDIGRIKIILTYLSIFSIIGGMGFSTSTLKLCSEDRSSEERIIIFKSALFFTLITSASLYILIVFLNMLGIFSHDKLIVFLIPIGLLPIISNCIFEVFISYFQAEKKINLVSKLSIFNKSISILGIIVFTYLIGIKGYYLAYNMSYLLMVIVCIYVYRSYFNKSFFTLGHFSLLSSHLKYSKSLMFNNLISELSSYVDVLLLSFFIKDLHEIGYYSFALTITIIFRLFPATVQQITSPYFSSLANKKDEFIKAYRKYNISLKFVVSLTFLIGFLILPLLIKFLFSTKFDLSISYFPYLALGVSLRQLSYIQSSAIFGLGKIHFNLYTNIITLTSNILIITSSIYLFGLIGAAIATIAGGVVNLICNNYYFKKALEISFKSQF